MPEQTDVQEALKGLYRESIKPTPWTRRSRRFWYSGTSERLIPILGQALPVLPDDPDLLERQEYDRSFRTIRLGELAALK